MRSATKAGRYSELIKTGNECQVPYISKTKLHPPKYIYAHLVAMSSKLSTLDRKRVGALKKRKRVRSDLFKV